MKAEGWGSITGQGIKIPQAMKHGQKKKKDCLTYAKSASQGASAFYTFWDKVGCN